MKVYVVEHGEYSDRHVVAVVDNEEKAKLLVDRLGEEANYTMFDTEDPNLGMLFEGYARYWVIRAINGTTTACRVDFSLNFDSVVHEKTDHMGRTAYVTEVLAPTEEHAVKIANDRFAKYLAQKAGL